MIFLTFDSSKETLRSNLVTGPSFPCSLMAQQLTTGGQDFLFYGFITNLPVKRRYVLRSSVLNSHWLTVKAKLGKTVISWQIMWLQVDFTWFTFHYCFWFLNLFVNLVVNVFPLYILIELFISSDVFLHCHMYIFIWDLHLRYSPAAFIDRGRQRPSQENPPVAKFVNRHGSPFEVERSPGK